MTNPEFSHEFDILYNNIMSNSAPGLTEYEKSVFLTKAQEEIVKNYFTSMAGGNKYQQGFDDSNKRQIDFSTLMVDRICPLKEPVPLSGSVMDGMYQIFLDGNKYGTAPEAVIWGDKKFIKEILFIVSERVYIKSKNDKPSVYYQVVPIKLSELQEKLKKPYNRPLKREVWRIVETFNQEADNIVEDSSSITPNETGFRFILHDEDRTYLVPGGFEIETEDDIAAFYFITYVMRPQPIILTALTGTLSIRGKKECSECTLNEELHPEILQRAVELAKSAYIGDLNSTVELGKRSE